MALVIHFERRKIIMYGAVRKARAYIVNIYLHESISAYQACWVYWAYWATVTKLTNMTQTTRTVPIMCMYAGEINNELKHMSVPCEKFIFFPN